MGPPLKKPPVYFTVAQVRFNPLLKLSDFLPSIQEGLRKFGFPAFTVHTTVALQLAVKDGQTVPQPVPHEQYLFANVEQIHCFVLSSDSLTFQSTNYGTYESFSEVFLEGLALVHKEVALDFTDRVGLRYLDHVFPKPVDNLSLYLAPEVQGLSTRLGGQPVHSYAEALNAVGNVMLRTRVVIQNGGLGFPPDLLPRGMAVQQRFLQAQGMHAILDTDGSVEGRALFSLEAVREHLFAIHEVIGAAFRATVTPHALAAWSEE
jgi:uncharacterized protein (TIGR04255 family)